MSLKAALAVGVPLEGVENWNSYYELHGELIPPAGSMIDVSAIEEKLGYKFRYPHLVQEALVRRRELTD